MKLFKSDAAAKSVAPATPPAPAARQKPEVPMSTVSAGVSFSLNGSTASWDGPTEDLKILGRFDGSINVRTLLVGPNAVIIGQIQAESLVVEGRIEGDTRATKVLLQPTAHVLGKLSYDEMIMQQGARISATVTCEPERGVGTQGERTPSATNDTIFATGAATGWGPRLVGGSANGTT